MKAFEYAKQYREYIAQKQEPREALTLTLRAFMKETYDLSSARGGSNEVVLGVVSEMIDKWRALARLLPEARLRPDGYTRYLARYMPPIYDAWQERKKARQTQ